MKIKDSLIALVYVLINFRTEYIVNISNLLAKIKAEKEGTEEIDLVLELRIGLHKYFSIVILKLVKIESITKEKADFALYALEYLFQDKVSYEKVLSNYIYNTSLEFSYLFHKLIPFLIMEAYCDAEDYLLTERARYVIQNFEGLRGNKRTSLEDIGVNLGLTKERIRQIKEKTKQKIIREAEKNGLKFYP